MNPNELWQAALADIELQISPANYITWFRNTSITAKNDGEVIIAVPSGFAKEWLENKYHKHILKAIRTLAPEIKEISYIINARKNPLTQNTRVRLITPQQMQKTNLYELPLERIVVNKETGLNSKYTFDSFIVGSSNVIAHAAAQAIIKQPGTLYNPLFIYGGVGLGKTHLLQAIGNEFFQKGKKIRYLSSEHFLNDLVVSMRNKKMDEFKARYRKIDALIIDDIQFIAGKVTTQEEFFHTFNTLYENNKQIILSSDRPPQSIATLEERLRSRFEGGMIADISYPEYEMRLAILQAKCKEKNLNLHLSILQFIAEQIQRNMRELEGALNILLTSKANEPDRQITLEDTKKALRGIVKNSRPLITHKVITAAVSGFYNIKEKEILSKNRRKELAHARQVIMYAMREVIHTSYPLIGKTLGGRDHTTVMHACNKIAEKLKKDEFFREEFEIIKQKILQL
ncbi:MAG: chromosomal replication initiator protein DnaA [Candidatus Spechtbacteria bacterium]|nr:chromosomal replication initiator protein DnaA [Candidatus Spechtbacteria bacterium]